MESVEVVLKGFLDGCRGHSRRAHNGLLGALPEGRGSEAGPADEEHDDCDEYECVPDRNQSVFNANHEMVVVIIEFFRILVRCTLSRVLRASTYWPALACANPSVIGPTAGIPRGVCVIHRSFGSRHGCGLLRAY